ncbi:MAG: peptidyl-prolyl cis-trans isomerase [Deltaproteobacteria bacterium]|nr:peptidyl-prolyl cis-trans isomerase [Deltaproteobacteria bacterium]
MRVFVKAISLHVIIVSAFLFAAPFNSAAEVVDRIVAIINDSVITLSELNAATTLAMDKFNVDEKKDPSKVTELKSKVLDSLVEQKLVKQAADKAGIDISEREIDNAVEDIKRQNGLTQESLLLALAQSGLTVREYREQLKEQIRQVKFMNKEFRSKVSIQAEDIEDYYKTNIDEFYGPASYRLNLIFVPSEDKAVEKQKLKEIQEGFSRGHDFRDLASHYSEGPAASLGGDMGYLKEGEMDKTIEAAARKLKAGEVSPPVVTPEGTYFIQLIDVKKSAPRPLDEVREYIHDRLFKKVMDERFGFWIKEVKRYAHIEIRF